MILVILGTERFAFDRLVRAADALKTENVVADDIFVQLGTCNHEPEHCRWERYLDFGDISRRVREARLVIAHAGAGTTLLCLHLGKRPILMPRRRELGEHIDDHQVSFARMMERHDYVDVAYEADALAPLVQKAADGVETRAASSSSRAELVAYLDALTDDWRR